MSEETGPFFFPRGHYKRLGSDCLVFTVESALRDVWRRGWQVVLKSSIDVEAHQGVYAVRPRDEGSVNDRYL